jgi:hypothetical protein
MEIEAGWRAVARANRLFHFYTQHQQTAAYSVTWSKQGKEIQHETVYESPASLLLPATICSHFAQCRWSNQGRSARTG